MKRHIRVSIALPHSGSPDLIKLKFSAGFYTFNKRLSIWSPDPDLGLILPKSRSIAGRSIEKGAHEFRELSAGGYGYLDVTKDYEIIRRLNTKTLWVYAEPLTIEVSRKGEIQQLACAISIDGDKYLLDFDKFAASKAEAAELRNFFFMRVRQSIALNLRTISNIVGEMPSMEDCDDAHRV